jgi:hypothetical protein
MSKSKGKSDERLEALHSTLEGKVAALTDSAEWLAWLETARKFHRYSFNNTLLILAQRPEATQVAGFRTWQGLGRYVCKGETSIGIFAPRTFTETDEVTGEKVRRIGGYRVVSVFDVSQTDGDPLPVQPLPVLLEGEAPEGLQTALEKIIADNGYTFERGECPGEANGVTMPRERRIIVRDDVSDAQAAKTTIHEVAHMLLHAESYSHRGIAEIEAESVAHLVASVHGLPTDTYTLPYVAGWSDGKPELVAATATNVLTTAKTILKVTDPHEST